MSFLGAVQTFLGKTLGSSSAVSPAFTSEGIFPPRFSSIPPIFPPILQKNRSALRADLPTTASLTLLKDLPWSRKLHPLLSISPSRSTVFFLYSNISSVAFPGCDPSPENLVFGAAGGRLQGSGSPSTPQTVRRLRFRLIIQLYILIVQIYIPIEQDVVSRDLSGVLFGGISALFWYTQTVSPHP